MSSKKPDKEDLIIPETPEAIDFVKALVARGEAAKVNPDGSLPPGATHDHGRSFAGFLLVGDRP